jgi:quercetin dioxygenase-like cupin family protein
MARPLFDAGESRSANLLELTPCVEGATVSKTLLNLAGFKQVVFAMDAHQELSEHRAPYVAIVEVLDGRLRVTIGGAEHALTPAGWLIMPPNAPHAVYAEAPTRFLLTLVRGEPVQEPR